MSKWSFYLLCLGLVCPAISWLTFFVGLAVSKFKHRYSSPVFVPIIGPVLLTGFVLIEGYPAWAIPIVWILDIGTMAFFAVLPVLAIEWWRYSSFTQLALIQGATGIERVQISLHKSNHYRLKKAWNRNDFGIVGLGEAGRFSQDENGVALVASFGLKRYLRRTGPRSFQVEEPSGQPSEWHNHSINGWSLAADCELEAAGHK